MNIFVIGRSYPEKDTGMIGIFEYQQAEALAKYSENNVTFLFTDYRSPRTLRKFGVKELYGETLPTYGYYMPISYIKSDILDWIRYQCFKRLFNRAVIKQGVPNVIHVHYPLLNLNKYIINFLKDMHIKIVCTEHWTWVQTKKINDRNIDLLKYVVETCDNFICVSKILKKSVVELTGTKKKLYVIPNMVSDDCYYKEQKNRDKIYRFLAIGRIVPVKKFDLTIKAFAKVFGNIEDARLIIIGDGPELTKLKLLSKNLGVDNKIEFRGFLDHKKACDIMRECNCVVVASELETFGVPWIEGWCCGVPVIGAKGNPIEEYFDEHNSRMFIMNDINNLEEKMMEMYLNRNAFVNQKIAEKASEFFKSNVISSSILDVFKIN